MRNLRTRIDRVARSMSRAAGKVVVFGPKCRAYSHPFDPSGCLTDEQRAMIRPDDTIIVVRDVREPLPHA